MTPERWKLVATLFRRARECSPSERSALLGEACAGDPSLRHEVESLLAVYDDPSDLLDEPALAAGAGAAVWAELGDDAVPDWREATSTSIEEKALRARGTRRDDADLVGATLDGKYRIDALIGRGGMGEVYRATHLQLERVVAVKLIRADRLSEAAAFERFLREARMVARLRHPNIVMVFDYGVAEGVGAYLVLEYLEGQSLRAVLRERTRLYAREALDVIAQVASALVAAHEAGVVHRDVKPDNVFLEESADGPSVKVLDFGLAKLAEEAASRREAITRRGAVLGTPAYMAPEQCLGEEADARTDVYALGCLLFEMLTGRAPFTAETTEALLYKQVHEAPEPPSALVPGVDPAIERVLLKALAKAREDRPRSAESFARALGLRVAERGPDTLSPGVATTEGGGMRTGAIAVAAAASSGSSTNLRHAVTRFVGREREIADIREWLARTRLVTLTGPGGIGKTRLAVETAAQARGAFRDGVWLVELAGIADASLVDQVVLSALRVPTAHGRPALGVLAEWLRRRELLLVLDNCEHLVDACARLTETLLEASAGLRVLATSREALGIGGEAVWPVPALYVPSRAEEAFESEAAMLFADRAALARPGFELARSSSSTVLELCRRLEGIPLAIELAAARVKVLTVEQILERLDDRLSFLASGRRTAPSRQQTLQATIDWSYDLLAEDKRALFRRLSVFAGGWELEAAEAVSAGDGIEPFEVLELLVQLVDRSLVTVSTREGSATSRYGMLELIRAYGAARLFESPEANDVRRRHADYYTALAEAGRDAIWAGHSAEWLERLEVEHDNIRAALAWLGENDQVARLRLAAAVAPFRELHHHYAESRACLESALAANDAAPPLLRVAALIEAGMVARTMGDIGAERSFYELGLEISRESGSTAKVGYLLLGLGSVATMQGDLEGARAIFDETIMLGRQLANDALISQALNGLGEAARLEEDRPAAKAFYEEALAVLRRIEHDHALAVTLSNFGAVLCEDGDLDGARKCYEEALHMARSLQSKEYTSLAFDGFASLAAQRGEWRLAAQLAGAADALVEEIGATRAPVDLAFRNRFLGAVREHLGETEWEAALAEGRALSVDDAVRSALATA